MLVYKIMCQVYSIIMRHLYIMLDAESLVPIHRRTSYISTTATKNNQITKQAEDLNRHFSKRDISKDGEQTYEKVLNITNC